MAWLHRQLTYHSNAALKPVVIVTCLCKDSQSHFLDVQQRLKATFRSSLMEGQVTADLNDFDAISVVGLVAASSFNQRLRSKDKFEHSAESHLTLSHDWTALARL